MTNALDRNNTEGLMGLGRIVIPMEVRRSLGDLRERFMLSIGVDGETIVLPRGTGRFVAICGKYGGHQDLQKQECM